jgi:type I restriction enzyme S subunit
MIGEGKTRGQVAILDLAACNNQNSAAIRVSEAGLPTEYTYYFLMGQYEKNRSLGSGNNQPALNKARVQNIPFPVPPLAEQRRIVAELERRLSVVEELEAAVNASVQRATRLRQSILQKAFGGSHVNGLRTVALESPRVQA